MLWQVLTSRWYSTEHTEDLQGYEERKILSLSSFIMLIPTVSVHLQLLSMEFIDTCTHICKRSFSLKKEKGSEIQQAWRDYGHLQSQWDSPHHFLSADLGPDLQVTALWTQVRYWILPIIITIQKQLLN